MIDELAERMDAKRLVAVARRTNELPVIQRLGFLLERTGHLDLAAWLAKLVRAWSPRMVLLEPSSSGDVEERNRPWHVLVSGPSATNDGGVWQ